MWENFESNLPVCLVLGLHVFFFQTQRIFEITIREVGEVQPQDFSYIQLLNILVRKMMEKMQLAQVDRHYFDPKAAFHLKEYRLELWVSTDFLVISNYMKIQTELRN